MVVSKKWKFDEPKVDMSHEGECDIFNLEGKYSLESTDPRESDIPPAAAGAAGQVAAPRLPLHCAKNTYLFTTCICISA